MSLNRLNATSDKFLLQEIADNTKQTGEIASKTPIDAPASMSSVGIFGANGNTFKALKVANDGTLAVDLNIDESSLATSAKQDELIDETQANGLSLSSIETDTGIIKSITQSSFGSVSQLPTTNGLALRTCFGIDGTNFNVMKVNPDGELSTTNANITSGEDDTLTEAQQVLIYGRKDESPTGLRALKVLDNGALNVNDNALLTRISKGEDAIIPSGSGGLQQNLVYGMDNQGDLEPLNIDNQGHLKITINDVDETNTGLKIAGETQLGSQVNIKVGATGNLRTHETLERINSTQTLTIPDTQTVNSVGIDMSDYQYIAIFGDTNNTTNTNIFIEYSTDDVNYYRGAGDNSKIIVVGASGNFFDQERIITKWVRISRPNTSGASETMTVNFTRA